MFHQEASVETMKLLKGMFLRNFATYLLDFVLMDLAQVYNNCDFVLLNCMSAEYVWNTLNKCSNL